MCRPIETRESLGAMGPAAAALFGYPPPPVNQPNLPKMRSMPWAIEAASMISPSTMQPFTNLDMLGMPGALPPPPPIVSFPKTVQAMPWMKAPNAEAMNYGMHEEQHVILEEAKPSALPEPLEMPRRNVAANEDFEAVELGELLDFSTPEDAESAEKDKEDLINLDDGFDGTEMSILYSFLVDTPDDKTSDKKVLNVESDDGILNLNVLANTPIESLMESLEEDFTDEELKMTPPPSASGELKGKVPEIKSRRLCKAEGCYKRSRSNGLCISHGGGRRCSVEGCDKSSQGGNLCIRHGGGKRCSYEGCDKAAQSNFLCKAHGGGPRCQVDGCTRSSQGGGFCRSHGGGKRCMFDGCTKGTQRGDYCALHGGSRLCEVPGCMRNDRGGGLCATHGGGKRCSIDGCGKPCRRKGLCSAHLRQSEHAK